MPPSCFRHKGLTCLLSIDNQAQFPTPLQFPAPKTLPCKQGPCCSLPSSLPPSPLRIPFPFSLSPFFLPLFPSCFLLSAFLFSPFAFKPPSQSLQGEEEIFSSELQE